MIPKLKSFFIIYILILYFGFNVKSQDISYSQYYAHPLYLNPSYAGTAECSRFTTGYRNYSGSIPDIYSIIAGYDLYINSLHGGAGVIINYSSEANLKKLNIGLIYAYHIKFSKELRGSFGVQAGIQQNSVDWNNLTFGDMVDLNNGFVIPTNENQPASTKKIVPDFSTGFSVYYMQKVFFGFALHHLNQPDNSFFNNQNSFLYRKYTIDAGAKINLSDRFDYEMSISPNIVFQQQNDFKYINTGLYFNFNFLIFGSWYKYNFTGNDGVILLLGLKYHEFKFGYSYNTSFSKTKSISNGSNEISLQINFGCRNKKKNNQYRFCPSFY